MSFLFNVKNIRKYQKYFNAAIIAIIGFFRVKQKSGSLARAILSKRHKTPFYG